MSKRIPRAHRFMQRMIGAGLDPTREPYGADVIRVSGWRVRIEGAKTIKGNKTPGQVLTEMASQGHRPMLIRPVEAEIENALITVRWEHMLPLMVAEELRKHE